MTNLNPQMKYKDTRITNFFPRIKKSEVSLIEGLRIRINTLEQERNMITKQLNELKEKQIKTTSKGNNKISNSTKSLSLKAERRALPKTGCQMLKETARASHHLLIRVSHPKHQLPLLETTGLLPNNSNNSVRRKVEYKMADANQAI